MQKTNLMNLPLKLLDLRRARNSSPVFSGLPFGFANGQIYSSIFYSTEKTNLARFVAEAPFGSEGFKGSGATAMDISRKGDEILIKTYLKAYYFKKKKGQSLEEAFSNEPKTIAYKPEPQGEAIAWTPDADGYFTVSEAGPFDAPVKLYFYRREGTSVKKKPRENSFDRRP